MVIPRVRIVAILPFGRRLTVAILPPGSETVLTFRKPGAAGRLTKFAGRLIAMLFLAPGTGLLCGVTGRRVFAGRAGGLAAGTGRFGGGVLFFLLFWANAGTANKNKQVISQVHPLL